MQCSDRQRKRERYKKPFSSTSLNANLNSTHFLQNWPRPWPCMATAAAAASASAATTHLASSPRGRRHLEGHLGHLSHPQHGKARLQPALPAAARRLRQRRGEGAAHQQLHDGCEKHGGHHGKSPATATTAAKDVRASSLTSSSSRGRAHVRYVHSWLAVIRRRRIIAEPREGYT